MSESPIGKVSHYFDRIAVAVLELTDTIRLGDTVRFLGHSSDYKQKIDSMQIEHKNVAEAKPGQEVALRVDKKVHPNDKVFKVTEDA
jgi:translation initiation factor IF-2